jgi:DNA polymerase III sliding clamp (beta) subunit (PCNA family)
MLTLQRTAAPVRTERESIAMVYNYGNGRTTIENVPSAPAPVVPESTIPAPAIAIVDSIAVELAERERKNAERELKRILETDWNSDPRTWTTKACAYYLGTICGMHLVTGIQEKENELELRAMVVDEFRKRNTETASVVLNRSAFLNAVRTAKKLNPRNPAKTVSLSVNGSVDVITGDNDARFSQCLAYAKKSGELRLTFPEQQLTAIATKLKSETLELTLHSVPALSDNVLTVAGGSATFELNVERPDGETRFQTDFPAEFAHNVQAGDLLHALNLTTFAVCTESTRYALAGLCFVPDSNSLDIAATDSRRLAVETVPAQLLGTMPELKKGETEQSKRFTIVPGNIIQILMDALKRVPAASIVSFAVANAVYSRFPLTVPDNLTPKQLETWETEQLKESHIERDSETGVLYCCSKRPEFVFECQNAFSIRGMELEGRFPRYRDVIPSSFNSEFTVDRAELLNACETVELSTTKESRGVDFSLPAPGSESIIILRGKSSTAKGQFICDCIPESGGIGEVITFDPQYVSEYLKRSKSDRIRLHVIDCNSCVMFTQETEPGNGSGKHIIMPLAQDR